MTPQMVLQIIVNSLMAGSTIVLIALGLSLVFGIMHIVNFAHGDFYMLGAFGVWIFFQTLHFNYFLSLFLCMLLVGALGFLLDRVFFRHVHYDFFLSFVISLGFVLILETLALLIFGIQIKNVNSLFQGNLHLAGATLSTERLVVILCSVALIVALWFFVQRSKAGQAMRAAAQDRDAAVMQGVSIDRMASLAMFLGCALAAAAGSLLAPVFFVEPAMGAPVIMEAFMVIILGGMDSITGTIAAGFFVGLVESLGSTLLGQEVATILLFVLVISFLLVRPTGLLGHA